MEYLDTYFEDISYNKEVEFSKERMPELPEGFTPSIGDFRFGCVGHYRRGLLHALDMQDHWLIHKDHFNPETHPIQHLFVDAPHWVALGALGLGLTVWALARGEE